MTALFMEHWWQIAIAAAVAVVCAVIHRVCANIAFEVSYRKGFFTQGAFFGAVFAFPGVLFVSTWRQIESPNSANQQQLEQTPDGGQEAWPVALAQIALGFAFFYYQLTVQVFLHTPQAGSVWFWLAALGLVVIGWHRLQGSYPSYALMPPLKSDGFDDPPDLIKMVTERHSWGVCHEQRVVFDRLAVAGLWVAAAATLALVFAWSFPLPLSPWLVTAVCAVLAVAGAGGWYLLRQREEALSGECNALMLRSAPDDQSRRLMSEKIEFFAILYRIRVVQRLRTWSMVLAPGVPLICLLIGGFAGRPGYYWLAGVAVAAAVALGYHVSRMTARAEEEAVTLEERDNRIGELTREAEVAAIRQAREQAREEVGEVYSFQMGDLVGRGIRTADDLPGAPHDPELAAEIARDSEDRARAYAIAHFRDAEFMQKLAAGRAWAWWGGVALLGLMVTLDAAVAGPVALAILKYTALGCFTLAAATFLPEKYPALRDAEVYKTLSTLAAIGVVIAVIVALSLLKAGV